MPNPPRLRALDIKYISPETFAMTAPQGTRALGARPRREDGVSQLLERRRGAETPAH